MKIHIQSNIYQHYYSIKEGHKNMLLILFSTLLISQALSTQDSNNPESNNQYIWFNWTSPSNYLSHLIIPEGGLASFYSHLNFPYKEDSGYKILISLYKGFSEFRESDLISCHLHNNTNSCKLAENDYLSAVSPITPEKTIGYLSSNSIDKKVLDLKSGQSITLYQKQGIAQKIQFIVTATSILYLIVATFYLTTIKHTKQQFFMQLIFSQLALFYQSSYYILDAIENWVLDNWKFWLFIPLTIAGYRTLDLFLDRCVNKHVSLKCLSISLSLNLLFYFSTTNTFIYPIFSFIALIFCQLEENDKNQSSTDNKLIQHQKALHKVRLLFLIIHLRLLFVKQSCYLIADNPQFYAIGLFFIILISIAAAYRRRIVQKLKEVEENKVKIKIINNKSDLQSEVPSLTASELVNYQCPICYEKIEEVWAKTPCHHIFHPQCIYKWLEKSQTCPIDRQKTLSNLQVKPSKATLADSTFQQ